MVLSAVELTNRNTNLSSQQIVEARNGNICRCGTFSRIMAAVLAAARRARQLESELRQHEALAIGVVLEG